MGKNGLSVSSENNFTKNVRNDKISEIVNDSDSHCGNFSKLSDETCKVRLVPVATWSKAWVYSHSPAAIVGVNPTGGMDVCLLCVLGVVR
jgi:hypothetical protein